MRRAFISVTLLATLATGITAAWSRPPEPRRLEPTSKWVLDYANERCTLLRNFGQGDKAVLLRMDSFGSRGNFRVTLSGKDVPRSSTPDSRGSFYFPGDRDSRIVSDPSFGTLTARLWSSLREESLKTMGRVA